MALVVLAQPAALAAGSVKRGATGPNPFFIVGALDPFRADLGGLNNATGGTFLNGRREISWEGVPDSASSIPT